MFLTPVQDAFISEWFPENHGSEVYLQVRQPEMVSSLVQYDVSGLPEGVEVVSAKLRLRTLQSAAAKREARDQLLLRRAEVRRMDEAGRGMRPDEEA